MSLFNAPFAPKHIVLKATPYSLFAAQRVKLRLECPVEQIEPAFDLIQHLCREYYREEMTIDDVPKDMKTSKLANQFLLWDIKTIALWETREQVKVTTQDTAKSLSFSRFQDMVLAIQMRLQSHVLEALVGRFYYTQVETLHQMNYQEAFYVHLEFPWFWIIPIYQQAITPELRLRATLTQQGTT